MNIPHPSTHLILFGSVKLLPELEHVGVFILRDTAVSAAGGAPGAAAGETIELTLQTIDLGHQIGLLLLPRPAIQVHDPKNLTMKIVLLKMRKISIVYVINEPKMCSSTLT